MRDRFYKDIQLLEDIRNNHLAHLYEKTNLENRELVPHADFEILDRIFGDIEFILQRVWHIVFDTTYAFPEHTAESKTFVRDFVDLMRFGSVDAILRATGVSEVLEKEQTKKLYWQYRQDGRGNDRLLNLPKFEKDE